MHHGRGRRFRAAAPSITAGVTARSPGRRHWAQTPARASREREGPSPAVPPRGNEAAGNEAAPGRAASGRGLPGLCFALTGDLERKRLLGVRIEAQIKSRLARFALGPCRGGLLRRFGRRRPLPGQRPADRPPQDRRQTAGPPAWDMVRRGPARASDRRASSAWSAGGIMPGICRAPCTHGGKRGPGALAAGHVPGAWKKPPAATGPPGTMYSWSRQGPLSAAESRNCCRTSGIGTTGRPATVALQDVPLGTAELERHVLHSARFEVVRT